MTSQELVRKFRRQIPDKHRASMDSRIAWLWRQRFGTVQMVHNESPDLQDKTACKLILQAIVMRDLVSIEQIFDRLEGGAVYDDELNETIRI